MIARLICWLRGHDEMIVIDRLNSIVGTYSGIESRIAEKHIACDRCGARLS